ncbi:hypothetical protein L226DRAFT_538860 [Lentinus tigrinus ALCF2SS1-7]|uniref:Uncharacterized protein n=1 Tax=Lentinus tigrinus ALCF2SS1-6 TaxID=1328759 RepID=A0A5C2RQP9_9APHY|nr:hypothetical protein L227DRAFT_582166 [Lentinus tigrinus ALCF2SS1-6]RPD53893.1 hypothetical protein L227DRAFT_580929 [Lentinus tigrinus ALCF2SS1-6]RPD67723.1 hypothetical protein L226DRAFT_541204 [Lentinus tigrinus ALCF2SS1-7]RPD70622.1 hypothetical protein L226DRAFT_538860 [Lentinus tigrinus ALCF2SS1-7]
MAGHYSRRARCVRRRSASDCFTYTSCLRRVCECISSLYACSELQRVEPHIPVFDPQRAVSF